MIALIADDDIAARVFMKKILQDKFNFQIIEAQNGIEALEKLRETPPDIIMLDLSMPFLSGIEFLETIRKDHRFYNLPVVVLSAIKNRNVVEHLIELGIKEFILKPLGYQNLLERLQKIIAGISWKGTLTTEAVNIKSEKRKTILLADVDLYFGTFISEFFDDEFNIIRTGDGAKAIKLFIEHSPEIVLIGEKVDTIDSLMLAEKIKEYDKNKDSGIYYCFNKYNPSMSSENIYDGFLKKSFTSESIKTEFYSKVLNKKSSKESLLSFLEVQALNDVKVIINQVFETIIKQKIFFTKNQMLPEEINEVAIQTNLIASDYNVRMKMFLASSRNVVEKLGEKLTEQLLGLQDNQAGENLDQNYKIFYNLLTVFSGRLCSTLNSHGLKLEPLGIEQIDKETLELYRSTFKILVPFKSETEDNYLLGVSLTEK